MAINQILYEGKKKPTVSPSQYSVLCTFENYICGIRYRKVFTSTVYIGFCDQPPSQGSRSQNPMEVAKSSGFPLGIATR